MLFTAYTLFQLRDDLVYSSTSLSIQDVDAAGPVFIKLNLIIGITLVMGLIALVIIFNSKSEEILYVEKSRKTEGKDQTDEEKEAKDQLSTSFVNDIIKSEKDEDVIFEKTLKGICNKLEAGIGIIYTPSKQKNKRMLEARSTYALSLGESQTITYEMGEGLVGQAAKERKSMIIDDIPEDYIKIVSGLGKSSPTHLLVMPFEHNQQLIG
ncbi:MAG: GAF domain-containing protein, partial [Fulvivirga sp.]|nr:GAF domain-containing protein [Fulvivirga sp.]